MRKSSTCSPHSAPPTSSSTSRCCTPPAGRAGPDLELHGARKNLNPLFDLVLRHVKAPALDNEAPFAMVASILEYDNFLGRVLTGRIEQGRARLNMPVKVLRQDGTVVETGRLTKLLCFRGLDRVTIEEAEAGEIIAVAGLSEATDPGHDRRAGTGRAAVRHPGRPADAGDDVPRQRRPAGRARGQEGHLAPDPRPAAARDRRQRRDQGHREQRERGVRGRRARRVAARRADRDHAPRRLRAHHRPPARADAR